MILIVRHWHFKLAHKLNIPQKLDFVLCSVDYKLICYL
jgi:hypothetical protein